MRVERKTWKIEQPWGIGIEDPHRPVEDAQRLVRSMIMTVALAAKSMGPDFIGVREVQIASDGARRSITLEVEADVYEWSTLERSFAPLRWLTRWRAGV